MIGRRIRHTNRYREILNALMKNGFSHFLFRVGLADRSLAKSLKAEEIDPSLKNIGRRLRYALQELGPTAIKLGQIASTRYDTLPDEITSELEQLLDHAPVLEFEHVKQTFEVEFEDTLDNLFDYFNPEPMATASIGQVHEARLFNGEEVVVKIQRPGLKPKMETDLEILRNIGEMLEERTLWAQRYRVCDMIDELSDILTNELDYIMEGRSGEQVARQFDDESFVKFPHIYWELTTSKVLTMEKITGIKVSNIDELDEAGYDRELIAKRLSHAMLKQILKNGFFHADPHSGNIHVLPKNTIAFLDFGETGHVSNKLKQNFGSIIVNLYEGDSRAMVKTFSKMDLIDEKTDIDALERDLDKLHMQYENVKMRELSLGNVIVRIFEVVYQHHIKIPMEMVMISKTILTLEGVLGRLDPEFSLMSEAEPFARRLVLKRFHPNEMIRKTIRELSDNFEILTGLPEDVKDVMSVLKRGRVGLDINVKHVNEVMRRLDKISNRIAFSILMLAFSIIMAGLIVGLALVGQSTVIWELPIIEIGAVIALMMFILMVIIIIRSNRM
ncbi:2-octaprenylphenol hydroxylase [Lentibacillus persicus]|uniref:2-octaprenylphenol hydroxylase n=1 Tax=Lentibacillus persicus TaxID=640948 RepID=A0A1I1S1S9_9BACI|nr:AarF/UbiB family protein [Lentibacillus persicus]SFD40459.1 2-octaprenylphenol hydroxylase [Lentibacillus persicus]